MVLFVAGGLWWLFSLRRGSAHTLCPATRNITSAPALGPGRPTNGIFRAKPSAGQCAPHGDFGRAPPVWPCRGTSRPPAKFSACAPRRAEARNSLKSTLSGSEIAKLPGGGLLPPIAKIRNSGDEIGILARPPRRMPDILYQENEEGPNPKIFAARPRAAALRALHCCNTKNFTARNFLGRSPDRVKWPMQSDLFEDYRPANVAPPFRILPWDHGPRYET